MTIKPVGQTKHQVKVLFDATIVSEDQGGNRTYALGAAQSLAASSDIDLTVITRKNDRSDWGTSQVINGGLGSANPYLRTVWRELNLPKIMRNINADILFVPAPEALYRESKPQVIVIHDLGPILYPKLYGLARHLRFIATVRHAVTRSSRTVCVSNSTRNVALSKLNCNPHKLVVIGQGPQSLSKGDIRHDAIKSGQGNFALYVGTALPHKNLRTLLKAFESPIAGMPERLVMCGPEYGEEVANLMNSFFGSKQISHLGFVSPQRLEELYDECKVVVLPTLHEGFGLPLLEAMQYGKPIVASDIDALVEVGGSSVEWVTDLENPDAWRKAIVACCENRQYTSNHISDRESRINRYSWQQTGLELSRLLVDIRDEKNIDAKN